MPYKKDYRNHQEHYLAYQKEYQKNHRKTVNIRRRKRNCERRIELLNFLGGKCVKCGFSDWRTLQIDHINGGGTRENKESGNNLYQHYTRIKKNPEKYQLLCANCNWIKKYENNEVKPNIKY